MGLFSSTVPKKIKHLHDLLSRSFTKLKDDMNAIGQWLQHLHVKSVEHEQHLEQHQQQLEQIQKQVSAHGEYLKKIHPHMTQPPTISRHQIKEVIDQYYSLDTLFQQIDHLHQRINELSRSPAGMDSERLDALHRRILALEDRKVRVQSTFKDRLVKKITKNSKAYVKSMVMSMIKKYGKIAALQLKEMVVDEQGLCSRSSFYRILSEVEKEPDIGVLQEGKEKTYVAKLAQIPEK